MLLLMFPHNTLAQEFQGVVCDYIYQNGSDGFPSSKLRLQLHAIEISRTKYCQLG